MKPTTPSATAPTTPTVIPINVPVDGPELLDAAGLPLLFADAHRADIALAAVPQHGMLAQEQVQAPELAVALTGDDTLALAADDTAGMVEVDRELDGAAEVEAARLVDAAPGFEDTDGCAFDADDDDGDCEGTGADLEDDADGADDGCDDGCVDGEADVGVDDWADVCADVWAVAAPLGDFDGVADAQPMHSISNCASKYKYLLLAVDL